jgi:hypothetical protein
MTTTATQLADWLTPSEEHPGVVLEIHCVQAAAELRRLDAEVEALRKDAERYRWLREADPDAGPAVLQHEMNSWGKWFYVSINQEALDAAIDAAMKGATHG